jgi:hypothetical protein
MGAGQRPGHAAVTPPTAPAAVAVRPKSADEPHPYHTERAAAGLRGRLLQSSGPIVRSLPAVPAVPAAASSPLREVQALGGGGGSVGDGGAGEYASGGSGDGEVTKRQL